MIDPTPPGAPAAESIELYIDATPTGTVVRKRIFSHIDGSYSPLMPMDSNTKVQPPRPSADLDRP